MSSGPWLLASVAAVLVLSVPGTSLVRPSGLSTSPAEARESTCTTDPDGPGPSIVSVSGRQLLVQFRDACGILEPAVPYTIKGVNWSPASRDTNTSPSDPNNARVRRPEFGSWYLTDIPLLKGMNVNTVRLYIDLGLDGDPGVAVSGLGILDEFYRHGIMVIMTVDDAINDMDRVVQAVIRYKDHPAILMWSVGNEWNINRYYGVASSVLNAAQRTEQAAMRIKELDTNHPVATSYGDIDINAPGLRLADTQGYVNNTCPSVDVWSVNVYRGDTFGSLFFEWASIATKPLFIGEFGADAFHATEPINPPPGAVNEAEQAQWTLGLWNDLLMNLSANDPARVAIGGTVFEWNDEWWKVQPAGSQQTGGWFSGAFPDGMANEEYFGIVTIDRAPREVYEVLRAAFHPGFPEPQSVSFRAVSRGATADPGLGVARFLKSATLLYEKPGGGGGGRGFNVAVIDLNTGKVIDPGRNFDTWGSRTTGTAHYALINYLAGVPDGRMILLAVADEAGLSQFDSCTMLTFAWVTDVLQVLRDLGSTQIDGYCYRDSWAMVAIKGAGKVDEAGGAVDGGLEAVASTAATISIVKDALPNGPQDFSYSTTGTLVPESFVLDDDNDGTLSNRQVPGGAAPGVYTVTESGVVGFERTSLVCIGDLDLGTTTDPTSGTATIDLDRGETIVCTYTSVQPTRIEIVKNTVPDDPQDFCYTTTGGLIPVSFALDDNTGDLSSNLQVFVDVTPGVYTVSETLPVAGFLLTALECVDPDGGTTVNLAGGTATIDVDPGETVRCAYTNTKIGTVRIIEDTVPDEGQDFEYTTTGGLVPETFVLDDNGDPALPNTQEFANVLPGGYTVTETLPVEGFLLFGLECVDPDGGTTVDLADGTAAIDLDAGETVTCTYRNKRPLMADAGPDQSVDEGTLVNLIGRAINPGGAPLAFSWTQTAGPPVVLSGAATPAVSFRAPFAPELQTITLRIAVTEGSEEAEDVVDVIVRNVGGSVRGVVSSRGQPVGGAVVRLTGRGPAVNRTTTTDELGFYAFTMVAPGGYAVQASKSGFGSAMKRIGLEASHDSVQDLTLRGRY